LLPASWQKWYFVCMVMAIKLFPVESVGHLCD
jgi:hypothetical protein